MYKRALALRDLIQHKSLFLFGPRQTGKSTLLRTELKDAHTIDLLEGDTFREFSTHPEHLRQRVAVEPKKLIVIDEVQKLPELLNEVHGLIERDKNLRFVLTGSSARSLRRRGVNLLGGRALTARLFPLVSAEIGPGRFVETLTWGALPGILDSPIRKEALKAYVGTYLQEEIRAEGAVRNLPAFNRFLEIAALCSGQQLNYAAVGNDAAVNERTVKDYFQILIDTFLGQAILPFRKTRTRKSVATPKFYFFDTGVCNAILGRFEISPKTREFGEAVEHRVCHELTAYLSYTRSDAPLTYWRPQRQETEVDFVVGDRLAIEVKGSGRVSPDAVRGIHLLSQEISLRKKVIVCNESAPRLLDSGVEVLPFELFCARLWAGDLGV